jgi:hypothetical protein
MSDLVAFLNARLDEDEAAARAAAPGVLSGRDAAGWCEVLLAKGIGADDEGAKHIARHDPGRVLREVAAERAILGFYLEPPNGFRSGNIEVLTGAESGSSGGPRLRTVIEAITLDLAAIWSDYRDYDPAWAPA